MAAGKKLFLSRFFACPQTFVSFYRWKKVEEMMSGVCGVLDYAGCFFEAAGSVDRVNGWEHRLCDGLGFVHDPSFRGISGVNMWGCRDRAWVGLPLVQPRWTERPPSALSGSHESMIE